jgi:hypothetical protein
MGWTQPHYLNGLLRARMVNSTIGTEGGRRGPVMKVTTIGIDLAKDVFGLHAVDGQGRVAFRKRLGRSRLWST